LSRAMIDVARRREAAERLGITYHVADGADLPQLGTFDLVTATYLLNYASDEATLHRMCEQIVGSLADGGEFVYLGATPSQVLDQPGTSRYGFSIVAVRDVPDGVQAKLTAHLDPPISFEIFYLPISAYERALHASGLTDFTWIPAVVSPEGMKEFGPDFWQDL